MSFTIYVNNTPIEVQEGETLLPVLRRNGIKIPTVCYMHGFTPSGACRLCVVEVEGKRDLITSCTYPVEPEMEIKTNSMRVIKARKALVEMLLANHPDDCLYCERNGNCELQWLAEEMNIKERLFFSRKNSDKRDHSSPSVYRDPAKCILCNRCVRVCEEVQLVTAIEFISRGNKTTVNSAFDKGLNVSSCINCGQCIMVCPTGALVDISHIEKVQSVLDSSKKDAVALLSPAFITSVAEFFNLKAIDKPTNLLKTVLAKMGFKHIYHMGQAADLNIEMETEALLSALENNQTPIFSSCCPAWIKYAEEFQSQMLENISHVKSPQQIMGRIAKYHSESKQEQDIEKLYTVSFVPCVANKFESSREENTQKGISEVDAVISVREFMKMLRSHGININRLLYEKNDKGLEYVSPAGYQMGYSGGKAEAIAHHVNHKIFGKNAEPIKFSPPKNPGSKREVKVKIGEREIGFAWVSGIREAQEYFDLLKQEGRKDIHYIEVMACQGGCAGGGGQPIATYIDKNKQRKKTGQELEKNTTYDSPGKSEKLQKLLGALKGDKGIIEELHTQFRKRDVLK